MSNWYDDLGESEHSGGLGNITEYILAILEMKSDPKHPTYITSNYKTNEYMFNYPRITDSYVIYKSIPFTLDLSINKGVEQIRTRLKEDKVKSDIKDWLDE